MFRSSSFSPSGPPDQGNHRGASKWGKHAADPSPAARTISVARRVLGTAAATQDDGGNGHHGGDIAARRPWHKTAYSTGGMVRIQAINASISLSFQVL